MTVAPRYEAYPDTKPTGIFIPIRSDQEVDLQSVNRVPECGFMPLCQGNDDLRLSYGKEPQDHATEDAFAELYDVKSNGVVRVFVDHPRLSTGKDIYGQQNNGILTYMESSDAADLDVRYSILCQAALGAAVLHPELNNVPGTLQETSCRDDGDLVFVGNDWPTALLLLHLKHSIQDSQLQQDVLQSETFCNYKKLDGYLNLLRKKLSSASAAMCIHNLAYQGVFSTDIFRRLCLPCTAFAPLSMTQDWKASLAHQHPTKCVIANVGQASNGAPIDDSGNINFLKSALLVCDEIVTVSPSYAKEIQSPEFGCGLNDILSCRGVT